MPKPLTDEQYDDLYQRWRHARDIAFASIGQPDRAEQVAYRDELADKLDAANTEREQQRHVIAWQDE